MIVWVLIDDKVGSNKQSIAIANKLFNKFIIKKISYNCLIKIPNIFRQSSLIGIDTKSSSNIFDKLPNVVISAGRRLSSVALNIKKRNSKLNKKTFLINIMNPNLSLKKFDIIILPKHDFLKQKTDNVIEMVGSLNELNIDFVNKEYEKDNIYKQQILSNNFTSPFISLFIGGDTKNFQFDIQKFEKIILTLKKIVLSINGTILISTSRRTNINCINIIKTHFKNYSNCIFYEYNSNDNLNNPYYVFLKLSKFIIVTADSISMMTEFCSINNNVYICDPINKLPKKHKYLLDYLITNSYATLFDEKTIELETKNNILLSETDRVAQLIKKKYDFNFI